MIDSLVYLTTLIQLLKPCSLTNGHASFERCVSFGPVELILQGSRLGAASYGNILSLINNLIMSFFSSGAVLFSAIPHSLQSVCVHRQPESKHIAAHLNKSSKSVTTAVTHRTALFWHICVPLLSQIAVNLLTSSEF